MSLHELQVVTNVTDVAFNANSTLIAVLHRRGVVIFEWKDFSASSEPPILKAKGVIEEDGSGSIIQTQISFFGMNEILIVQRSSSRSVLRRFSFDDKTSGSELVDLDMYPSPTTNIMTLSSFCKGSVAHSFVQDRSGKLFSLGLAEHALHLVNFPTYLPWVEMCGNDANHISFGMSNNGHLYANARVLAKNCTSFLVTHAHLIFSTTTHLLKFVHITQLIDGIYIPYSPAYIWRLTCYRSRSPDR